jgi:hypothetical protein
MNVSFLFRALTAEGRFLKIRSAIEAMSPGQLSDRNRRGRLSEYMQPSFALRASEGTLHSASVGRAM